MKRILLRLIVFFIVAISARENTKADTLKAIDKKSNLDPKDQYRDSAKHWENQRTQYDAGHGSELSHQPRIQRGDGDYRLRVQPQEQQTQVYALRPNGELYPKPAAVGSRRPVAATNPIQYELPAQVLPPRANTAPPLNRAPPRPVTTTATPPLPLALAGKSEGQLATTFMAEIGKVLGNNNFVINPFGIWSIVVIVYGVAGGRTAKELANLLGIEVNSTAIENAYTAAHNAIQKNTNQVESKTLNMVARPESEPLKQEFQSRLRKTFLAEEFEVNFLNPYEASRQINSWAASATRNRITNISKPEDFKGLRLLLGSASFFKGRWKYPFNETGTFPDEFKDENDVIIGSVAMMRSREMYKYGYSSAFDSQVIELPYGDGETSMLVFLPRRKVSLQLVLDRMRGLSLAEIIPNEMSEEEVDLSFPRFTTYINVPLNQIFVSLNAGSMLNPGAILPGLSEQNFISRVSHSAEIETSEQGTTASAVTSAQVSYKVSSASFHANRPFIYFINHVPTRLVLFAGKYCKP